jgi:hypothetical protein
MTAVMELATFLQRVICDSMEVEVRYTNQHSIDIQHGFTIFNKHLLSLTFIFFFMEGGNITKHYYPFPSYFYTFLRLSEFPPSI